MNKKILYGKEAREKLKNGVNKIAKAVSVTLGARGRNVLIARAMVVDYGVSQLPVHVTKDGVTVAREVQLDDPFENVGASALREASEKTMLEAGDGTTTTIVLAQYIFNDAIEQIEGGVNPMEFKRGMDEAAKNIVEELKKISTPVSDKDVEKIRQVATVSANNDHEIGNLIAEAYEKIGHDGIINIEEASGMKTEIKTTDGFEFLRGYINPHFVTDAAKMICELENPYIILYEKQISQLKTIEPIVSKILNKGSKSILIVCEDMDSEALGFLIKNKLMGNLNVCVVQSPNFGQFRRDIMEDIAVATGGEYLSDVKGGGIVGANVNQLGSAQKVIVSRDKTTIISSNYNKPKFDKYIIDLRTNLAATEEHDEREIIEKRIAKLTASAATIFVGGITETEMKERKDRVDDAVRATKAAIAEGYVPGGGTAFMRLQRDYFQGYGATEATDFEKGKEVVYKQLDGPIKQILENCGTMSSDILSKLFLAEGSYGYNAITGNIEDLAASGILDPVKVLRCAIQNSVSVVGNIITAECLIVDTLN